MSEKVISVIPELCTGCTQCEMICSFVHEKCYSSRLARIKVVHFEDIGLAVPVTCAYCEKPVCEEVCPTGAMSRNPETGAAEVKADLCIGCKECVNACPFGAITTHPRTGVAMRCDLCGGDPSCVKHCPVKALKFEPLHLAVKNKQRMRAEALNLEQR